MTVPLSPYPAEPDGTVTQSVSPADHAATIVSALDAHVSAIECRDPLTETLAAVYCEARADLAALVAQATLVAEQASLDAERAEAARALLEETTVELRSSREALRETLNLLEEAVEHITEDLQPEFQKLADGQLLSWPSAWRAEPYNQRLSAQRLATWWHGVGIEETIAKARAALAGGDSR